MDRREIRLLVYPCYRYLAECLAGVRRSMLFKERKATPQLSEDLTLCEVFVSL